jgi:hypothetical protein
VAAFSVVYWVEALPREAPQAVAQAAPFPVRWTVLVARPAEPWAAVELPAAEPWAVAELPVERRAVEQRAVVGRATACLATYRPFS